jgi:hypothetical protein
MATATTTSSPAASNAARLASDMVDAWIRRIREALGHERFRLSVDAAKLHVTESPCTACNGEGSILLLVSRRPCRRCGGRGIFNASLDFPLSDARVEQFCRLLRERQA